MAAEIVIIGAAVHAISLKEQQISTLAEDSVRAFSWPLKSMIECTLFSGYPHRHIFLGTGNTHCVIHVARLGI